MMGRSSASRPGMGCFETHLREAIELNRERLPLYAQLTDGESTPLSRQLIWMEHLALPVARYVDRRAAPFQVLGIGIARDEFVAMSEVPPFRERADPPLDGTGFSHASGRGIARRIRAAARSRSLAAAGQVIESELSALASAPCYHCMLRHLLESALRITRLAPTHIARADALEIRSPASLSMLMLRMHLLALGTAARLDARAAPLQRRGFPILCQDVPPIPPVP